MIGENESSLMLCSINESGVPLPQTQHKTDYIKVIPKPEEAVYKGYIKDFSMIKGSESLIEIVNSKNNSYLSKRIRIDSDGSFSEKLTVDKNTLVYLRIPGINYKPIPAVVSPGKTTFQFIDLAEFKIYVIPEYYTRKRLTMFMGETAFENNLLMYMDWINEMPDPNKEIWNKFINTATLYELKSDVGDAQMNEIALFIAENHHKYKDDEALKKAKYWSAKTLLSSPENHVFNSTFNIVLQNLGESMEGLQHLVKALEIAQADKNPEFVSNYKSEIKKYISKIIE